MSDVLVEKNTSWYPKTLPCHARNGHDVMKTLSRFVIKFTILIVGMLSCFDRADHLNDEGFVTRMGSTWPATEVGR